MKIKFIYLILLFFIIVSIIFLFSCNTDENKKKYLNDSVNLSDTNLVTLSGSIFCVSNNKLYLNLYTHENGCRLNLVMDSLLKQNVIQQYEANIGLLPNYKCLEATVFGYYLQDKSVRTYLYKRYDFHVLTLDWTKSDTI